MSAESVTRRPGAEPAGRGWLRLVSCGVDGEISHGETLSRSSASVNITLSNELVTISNIFQFVMT